MLKFLLQPESFGVLMLLSRRSVCAGLAALIIDVKESRSEIALHHPRPEDLEPGDFLWTKPPCDAVPYQVDINGHVKTAKDFWEGEKRAFLEQEKVKSAIGPDELDSIRKMTFEDFLKYYQGSEKQPTGVFAIQSNHESDIINILGGADALGVYCGHAAIVGENGAGQPTVIEALWQKTVETSSYENFLKVHSRDAVWHGRLKDHSPSDRTLISDEGMKYIGVKYDFFNFDLNDASGFYCSKLPWLCVYRALKVALDDKNDSHRSLWFTPKQMTKSSHITMFTEGNFVFPDSQCFE